MPDVFAGLPCDDEAVARESAGDYATLAPKCLHLAEASDGAMDAGAWVLASPSTDFAALGVQPGHVVVLSSYQGTDAQGRPKTYPLMRLCYGVQAVAGTACTLRALGSPAGLGRPAHPPAALSGIAFSVPSALPVIADEAVDVRRTLGIAADVDLSTLPDLRKYTALRALRSLYFQEYRQTAQDTWRDKMAMLDAQLASMFADLMEVYGSETAPNRALIVGDLAPVDPWCNPLLRWDRRGPFGYPPSPG